MNDPFEFLRNKEAKTEEEARRLKVRTSVLLALFCGVLAAFVGVLYNAQVVRGEDYLAQAAYRVTTTSSTETVNSVRGDILDRYGRVLATNTASYKVTLDTSAMGERRNEILLALMDICREEGVTWTDNLPVSKSAPWRYTQDNVFCYETTNEDGETEVRGTYLGRLMAELKVVPSAAEADLTAEELLRAMCGKAEIPLEEGEPISGETRELLGVLYETAARTYQINYNEYVFASGVDITFISKVKEHGLDGVKVVAASTRKYETSRAAHVLGRVGLIDPDDWPTYRDLGYPMNEYVGKGGVELAFESELHGSSGVLRTVSDEDGNVLEQSWDVEPEPGNNVVLTLDMALQATTEDLLTQFEESLEESSGAAAVVVDMTGGVLAMASYPDYSVSQYNRATQGLYAPGSTFKMCTAIAALSNGVIEPSSTVICTGLYHYYDATPACWIWNSTGGTHGSENVTEAITDSCNIFFYDVGLRTGIQAIDETATKFGLGQRTGIEIAESQGYVAGPETSAHFNQVWYGGETMYASIGQGNHQFTPLQLANYVATLVNGGNHYQAHLLKEIRSSDQSQVLSQFEPVLRDTIEIDPADLEAVKRGMYDLSKTASMARYFASLPVEVGCKTGTAQVQAAESNAVFVCFAPYDDPQVALCLVAEQGASGGSLAQVAAGILAQYFSTDSQLAGVTGENVLIR